MKFFCQNPLTDKGFRPSVHDNNKSASPTGSVSLKRGRLAPFFFLGQTTVEFSYWREFADWCNPLQIPN